MRVHIVQNMKLVCNKLTTYLISSKEGFGAIVKHRRLQNNFTPGKHTFLNGTDDSPTQARGKWWTFEFRNKETYHFFEH